ncbi:DUF4097 family beta strand repeat protein [candidate division WOR-3 bacterium]|nr:DUF4097 family beta strand repeat protein [candidate division WOR-3 bacterium]
MKKHLFVLCCVIMVIVACTTETKEYDYELERTETRTWPATGINQINAATVNGEISVAATLDTLITADITRSCRGEDSLDAEDHIDDIEVTDNIAGGQLNLEADMPDNDPGRNYRADFDMTAPAAMFLDLATVNGEVLIQNMTAGVRVRITNGAVTTENLSGSIDVATVNGAMYCDMEELAANQLALLTTTNGEVTLLLPSDVVAEFDAITTNGEVMVTGFSSVTYTTNQMSHKAGTIGSGGGSATIDITVVNGNITIQAR